MLTARHPEAAVTWKASSRWRTACCRRNRICLRKKSNNHLKVFTGPKGCGAVLKRHFAVAQRRIVDGCSANTPANGADVCRQDRLFNVDAVPVEWACGADKTLESTGTKRVIVFSGKGCADSKRWCTLNVTARNLAGDKISGEGDGING